MNSINKISVKGDIVEVEYEFDGALKNVRRHVQGYNDLSDAQKLDLWYDMIGVGKVEYVTPGMAPLLKPEALYPAKLSFFSKLNKKIWG